MIWFKRSSHFLTLATALTLGLAVNVPERVQAKLTSPSPSNQLPELGESTRQITPSPEILVSSSFPLPPPPGSGSPVNTVAGGTRSGPPCIENEGLPILLVPASKIEQATVAEYPTISWYLPKTTAQAVEFVLKDESGQKIYSTSYALAQSEDGSVKPGIMSLTIPSFAKIPPLEVGKQYSWKLKVMCSRFDSSAVKYESEEIPLKRVAIDPALEARIDQASLEERFALYQEADVWYETLNTMLDLLQKNPNDQELASAWDELLQ